MSQKLNFRNLETLKNQLLNDEGTPTASSNEQKDVEALVLKKFADLYVRMKCNSFLPELMRHKHSIFLTDSLCYLGRSYESLDSSRPWICYWVLHALSLLEVKLQDNIKNAVISFLKKCQNSTGGFGGGPGQLSHLAPTYAAVNALIILGTKEAYNVINRKTLLDFLWSIRESNGSFRMHVGGEVDIRGVYCALAVASVTNILNEKLCNGVAEWVVSCQTYEGGFSGVPGMEAHGGYTFCGLASLIILRKPHLCDIQGLLRWLVNRQMKFEGGFQGRTNKLVDGCYSFWQGGTFALIHSLLGHNAGDGYLFNIGALQEYILTCCQHNNGGLIDKPTKHRDEYHSCYVLSGLSVAQHFGNNVYVLKNDRNEVANIHPVYNIKMDLLRKGLICFSEMVPL